MNFEYPEGATPLDPDETEGIRLMHISTRSELDRWEQANINEAMIWLGNRRNKQNLISEEFVCRLHKKMFEKVWNWAGSFRKSNKNIGVDWTQIPIELRGLIEDTNFWITNNTYSPDEIAIRFHHRLVWIHLFPNGNGRHARLMADRMLIDKYNLEPFSWGRKSRNLDSDIRTAYINALRDADNHDYEALIKFARS